MKPAPTYEEFKAIIWNQVLEYFKGVRDEAQLKAYLEHDGEFPETYNSTLQEYLAGKTTYRKFTEGVPARLATNLIMCYEGD